MNQTELSSVEIFWCTMFSLMLSASVFGNFLVIWIVLAHRRMRTVTNFFLVNLSLTDFLMASLNGAPNFVYMLLRNWIFGSMLCVVNNFVANLTVGLSAFTMVAVSADRFVAIVRPLQPRMTKGIARRVIALIWICSAIIASPCLIYSEKIEYNDSSGSSKSACILLWESGKSPYDSNIDFAYNVCLLVITYFIPILAMLVCYSAIIYTLWYHKQIGETAQLQSTSMASKRKIVRMFVVIVSSFAVCWLPYHAYFIYTYYDGSIVYEAWVQHLYLSFYWLAMSTSMINPIIYYLMNTRFRNYIQAFILKCLLCRQSEQPVSRPHRRAIGRNPVLLRHCSQSCSAGEETPRVNHKRMTLVMTRNNFPECQYPTIPMQQFKSDGTR